MKLWGSFAISLGFRRPCGLLLLLLSWCLCLADDPLRQSRCAFGFSAIACQVKLFCLLLLLLCSVWLRSWPCHLALSVNLSDARHPVSLLVLKPTLALRALLECVGWSKVATHRPVNPASLLSNSSVDSGNLGLATPC